MAEPGKARVTDSPRLNVNINANYDPNVSHGDVDNGGEVYFNCAATGGALIYTSPTSAFDGETNGYLTLVHGNNGPFTPNGDDFNIDYCCCAVGSNCSPQGVKEGGGYSIQVGNPPEGGKEKK
ncbi:MAG TPA: hypothetical protein VKR82_16790 [Candidatus Acidoferrales bacterium]|jgi:hypothetical protein|nr:hypothetical protein [Candidatus Acidoferrales bacterium]